MRVFMWAAGTLGFQGWAISEMPDAQKAAPSSVPGICLANSGEKLPCTVEMWTPIFSKTRPCMTDISPPPPSGRDHRSRHEAARLAVGARTGDGVLDRFEGGAELVAQGAEPGAGDLLF